MLKINVAHSRKVGEANYGSRGASVSLEMEVESGLVREPGELHEKIRYLFGLAKRSVEEELNGTTPSETSGQNGNGFQNQSPRNGRSATQSQVRAIHAIANRNGVNLTQLLKERFQADQAGELSISQASELIDQLKAEGSIAGDRR